MKKISLNKIFKIKIFVICLFYLNIFISTLGLNISQKNKELYVSIKKNFIKKNFILVKLLENEKAIKKQ